MSEKPNEYQPINYAAVPPWERFNRLAIVSLVLSLLAVGLTPVICGGGGDMLKILGPAALVILPVIAIGAVVTGAISVHQMKHGHGRRGMGLAVAGITVGGVYLAIYGYLFIAFAPILAP